MKRSWMILIGLVFFTNVFVVGGYAEDIKKSFQVGSGGLLTIESDIGAIEVRSTDGNRVDVEVLFRTDRWGRGDVEEFLKYFDVDFRQSGNDVFVKAEYNRERWNFWDSFGRHLRVKFLVTVPRKYNLDLKTAGGSISVDDLEGEVSSRTSGGSLDFGRIKGPLRGRTSGGSIKLDGCEEKVDVETSGGSIGMGRVSGDVNAHTSGGSIHVEEVMGSIDATTSGGSVTAHISRQPKNDCRLTTSGSGITVYLNRDVKLDVDARTSGGRVRADFPITTRGEVSKRSLKGKVNGGGPELYLRTSGGSISLREM